MWTSFDSFLFIIESSLCEARKDCSMARLRREWLQCDGMLVQHRRAYQFHRFLPNQCRSSICRRPSASSDLGPIEGSQAAWTNIFFNFSAEPMNMRIELYMSSMFSSCKPQSKYTSSRLTIWAMASLLFSDRSIKTRTFWNALIADANFSPISSSRDQQCSTATV